MKYQILAGTLGLVLFMGIVPLPAAHANIFLIDNFENDNFAETCDISLSSGSGGAVQTAIVGVIDLIRECKINIDVSSGQSQGAILVKAANGMFSYMGGSGVQATVDLIYDGEALPVNGRSLGLDLSNSKDLRIIYSKADFQNNGMATLIDSAGMSASQP